MLTRFTILAVVLAAGIAIAAIALSAAHTSRVVASAPNTALHETVLVNTKGLTLYSLSAERRGKFICTQASCLALWHPLVVAGGVTPTGAANLGTVKRPDGRRQVTFRGGPLYTFSGDHRGGDAKGQGLQDVGTWHAAAVHGPAAPSGATTTTTSGGGKGYGY